MLVVVACLQPAMPWAGNVSLGAGAQRFTTHVASVKDLRDRHVVKQQYDYSCGASSLATLLSEQLDDRVSEQEIIEQLLSLLNTDESQQREKDGFSLLDMQRIAEKRGHRAAGFRIAIDQLRRINRAVIVFIKLHGEAHFSVLRGIRGDRVFLSDSSLGNVRMPIWRFLESWANADGQGIIFVVERPDGRAELDWRNLPPGDFAPPEHLGVRQLMSIGAAAPRENR